MTAPQPIAPPDGNLSPHTKAQQLSPQQDQEQQAVPATPVAPAATPAAAPAAAPPAAAPAASPQISLTGSPQPQAAPPAQIPAHPGEVNISGAAPTPTVASAKKGMPAGAKWAIIGILVLVVAVAVFIGMSLKGEREETNMVNDLLARAKTLHDDGKLKNGIEVTEKELQGVLKRTTDSKTSDNRNILLRVMAFAKPKGDYDVNAVILEHVTTVQTVENIRADIFKTVMSKRKSISNVTPLLEFASSTQEDSSCSSSH